MRHRKSIVDSRTRQGRRSARMRCSGFTLIETALATIIVGLGIVSTMRLFASCTIETRAAGQMSVAMMLVTNIQESMGGLAFADPGTQHAVFGPESGETLATFDDIDDFDGVKDAGKTGLNPPIDSMRTRLNDMSQYTQVISVTPVNPAQPSVNADESTMDASAKRLYASLHPGAVRVRVRVLYQSTPADMPAEVYQSSWIRTEN